LACPNAANSRSSSTFGSNGETTIYKTVALEGGREKEGRDIMVEKLNYGNHGVPAATNNTKC
jgi:hypothetical protein